MSTSRSTRTVPRRLWMLISCLSILAFIVPAVPAVIANTPDPASVTIAGSLQSELGCAGDWDPACALSHLAYDAGDDVWQQTFTIPAGSFEYKAALNDSWTENYGLHAAPGGANIPINLGADTSVKFYYDHKTHWVTDNQTSVISTAVGSFQSEMGCGGDWDPGCLRSWLEDPDGDGTYSFITYTLPPGNYEAKVAINESWSENYGQGGAQNGANIPFQVFQNNSKATFTYNSTSHLLTIDVQAPGPAIDNDVWWDGLRHDSRDLLYRTPGGAVPAGTPVVLRFRTYHNDVTGVKARVYDLNTGTQSIKPMTLAASDVSCYQDLPYSCDFWEITLPNTSPNNLWYRFLVTDGTKTVYYADNTAALDGGLGSTSDTVVDNSYALMVYDPAFNAPSWSQTAVIYQIFPDRFRDGRADNNPKTGDIRYDDPVLKLAWLTLPEGYCRAYSDAATNCPRRFGLPPVGADPNIESPRGRDYMGGDLKGIDQNLDYLVSLGVNTLYLNPIFDSASNHGYDTQNYYKIDPYFGTQKDWDNLVKHAKQLGVRIILDGVYNHMSSDSPFFDRYHHYTTVGACESLTSPYRSWFTFHNVAAGTGTCVGSAGANSATYDGWFGFDSIPVLNKTNPDVQSYFLTGSNSVAKNWLIGGANGWRLDVMGDSSFPSGYWESFRQVVKATKSDTLIVGELWQKDSTLLRFLRGDRADTTMNYRLRDAVIGLLTPGNFDAKGFADSGDQLSMTEFANRIASIREDYPDAALYSAMNLLDSHDTVRLLWAMTPGNANTAEKELNAANLSAGKQMQKIASLIQFTLPGAPTIYYGDEVAMTGGDDPDDRRTYPWTDKGGMPDMDMFAHYQQLAALHSDIPALTAGNLQILLADDANEVAAYGRKTTADAAIVVINRSASARSVSIPVAGFVPDGVAFDSLYGVANTGSVSAVASAGVIMVDLAPKSAWLLDTGAVDLLPLAAPANLTAAEGNANVSLEWSAVPGAAGYNVYHSPLSGGGWVKANTVPVTATTFDDTPLKNGQKYYFVVTSLDDAGNESAYSAQVSAMPHLTIGWANLQWPPTMTHEISVVNRTDNAYGQVWIDGATSQPGATPGLKAQLGYGPVGSDPATDTGWIWIDAVFNVDAGNNDEFMASMLPDVTGTFDYLFRYTVTGGREWLYADLNGPVTAGSLPPNPGKLTVTASTDTTPPDVPANLRVTSASTGGINLEWDANQNDPSLYGYEVLRSDVSGGPYTLLSRTTGTTYADTTVSEGLTYYYVVRAVDYAFNRSADSAEVYATAELRTVTVNFTVTVPVTTDATGRSVYIAGTLDRLDGGLPSWNPGGTVLTRVDATHWTITLTGKEYVQIEYKYTLGDWDHVEKDASCGEIANRQLTLTYGADGIMNVNDTVLNWRNISPCGN